ncbi:MAG: hypothetical protein HPY62_14455 [Bacteroidales bacterium]|nr:hypothetical protein [Bacteroidales bacterium]
MVSLVSYGWSAEAEFDGTLLVAEVFSAGPGKKSREVRIKKPKAVTKAEREQKAREKRLNKEYEEFVEASRKRAYDIQSPEVKERIKANRKETAASYKMKKKSNVKNTNRANRKYRSK